MPLPTGADVAALLATSGMVVDPTNLASYAKTAAGWWGTETGWKPFVGAAAVQSYDPPGPKPKAPYTYGGGGTVLKLRNGLLSVTSLTVRGSALTQGSGFWLVAGAETWPCEAIRFAYPIVGPPQTVVITGVWGFVEDDPDNEDLAVAFRAITQRAAADYASDTVEGVLAAGISKIKRGSDEVAFDPKMLASSGAGWRTQAARAAEAYKRITSVL